MRIAFEKFLCLLSVLASLVPFNLGIAATIDEDPEEQSSEGTIDSRSTATSTSFNDHLIDGLPIIGHNYQDVLVLAPGVTDTDGDGNPNVHGARQTGLQYRLDGGNITDPLLGTFGHNLNPLLIEGIEVITAGAPAEFGRADGGFTRITSRSGGNDFEGRLAVYWQGKFLNGEGAGNNDLNYFDDVDPKWRDLRTALSLGGPIVRDRLWYFVTAEYLDTEQPFNQIGSDVLVTSRGLYGFGKLSFRADAANDLTLQIVGDDHDFHGLGQPIGATPDSDFERDQDGFTAQLGWRSRLSSDLLLESRVTHFDTGIAVTPVSDDFRTVETILRTDTRLISPTVTALYPCSVINCDPRFGEMSIYQFDFFTGQTTGPYYLESDDSRVRNTLEADLSYSLDGAWGDHDFKGGVGISDERFHEDLLVNPVLYDLTSHLPLGNPAQIQGSQVLTIAIPQRTTFRATSFSTGFYVSDSWRPLPNLTLNLGVRLDREETTAPGYGSFDPRAERKESIRLWAGLCREAIRQSVPFPVFSNCHEFRVDPTGQTFDGQLPSNLPTNAIRSFLDTDMNGVNDVPADVASLDLDGNGFINPSTEDREALVREFTTYQTREPEGLEIDDAVLSPRAGISWDPWADGKTRLFAHWGRYHDRFTLDTIAHESVPDTMSFTFVPGVIDSIIRPGSPSLPGGDPSINQVVGDLEIPRTDEFSLGVERELWSEWSVGLTYIRRQGFDLLQDVDLNHHTCPQSSEAIGIQPLALCGTPQDTLNTDRFGALGFSIPGNPPTQLPNGVPDLYAINDNFNQVLRVGNYNSYDYRAWEVTLTRRLHRNWQMQASYTRSEATGQAEGTLSPLGDDPEVIQEEEGLLDYDQQHVVKLQAVTHMPHRISLGGAVRWSSGAPFSVTENVSDLDSGNSPLVRTLYPTGKRNDQRNEGSWRIDGRVEKGFRVGRVDMAGFLIVENILDSDDLTIVEKRVELATEGIVAYRDSGRRFEIGAIVGF